MNKSDTHWQSTYPSFKASQKSLFSLSSPPVDPPPLVKLLELKFVALKLLIVPAPTLLELPPNLPPLLPQILSNLANPLTLTSTSSQSLNPCSVRAICTGGLATSLQMRLDACRMRSRSGFEVYPNVGDPGGDANVGEDGGDGDPAAAVGDKGKCACDAFGEVDRTNDPELILKCRFCAYERWVGDTARGRMCVGEEGTDEDIDIGAGESHGDSPRSRDGESLDADARRGLGMGTGLPPDPLLRSTDGLLGFTGEGDGASMDVLLGLEVELSKETLAGGGTGLALADPRRESDTLLEAELEVC